MNKLVTTNNRLFCPCRLGRIAALLFLLIWSGEVIAQAPSRRCQTPLYDSLQQARNPSLLASRQRLNALLAKAARERKNTRTLRTQEVVTIPVVVHVVHNNASGEIGGRNNGNISDAQIQAQIQVLNEDYRRQPNTNGFNNDPLGADVEIEFQLARFDPNGCPTTGITRTYDAQASFDVNNSDDDKRLKALSYWPSNRYLNIWVTSLDNNYLGYAQFPDADNIVGLATSEPERTDGVVINHRVFGKGGSVTSNVYANGRTTTHEIGHWLGLVHTWGDIECFDEDCDCGTDYVADTPPTGFPNETTDCDQTYSFCTGNATRNQIENYMDYSPDLCMNLFTQGQKARMREVLQLSPRRADLVAYASAAFNPPNEVTGISLKPNPADEEVTVLLGSELCNSENGDIHVDVVNAMGQTIYRETFPAPASDVRLDVRPLTNGLYFIRVRANGKEYAERLMVSKAR